ncbi:claudin-4-like isoform X1 [Polypterus senegalus]|uniref:claudin-4-like isoform X1 n=1 Tax=Polypterus senegalus TaxID=55291 RepID=UPI0019634526|nr:claudin-4-like isoform X1 [Polypterus senegalus]
MFSVCSFSLQCHPNPVFHFGERVQDSRTLIWFSSRHPASSNLVLNYNLKIYCKQTQEQHPIIDFISFHLQEANQITVSSVKLPMYSAGVEILGVTLCAMGWLGAMTACGLPMWRVTAFIGQNIVVAQVIWEGLWMNCVVQSTGQMQCKIYDEILVLPQDIQAGRALTLLSILTAFFGILIFIVGAKCTNCMEATEIKPKIIVTAGIVFIISGFLMIIPVSWSANTIVMQFNDPDLEEDQKREFGNSLYFGWAAACLLLSGGALLCCSCPSKMPKHKPSQVTFKSVKSADTTSYSKKEYV